MTQKKDLGKKWLGRGKRGRRLERRGLLVKTVKVERLRN